jgi:hypothetical protein
VLQAQGQGIAVFKKVSQSSKVDCIYSATENCGAENKSNKKVKPY